MSRARGWTAGDPFTDTHTDAPPSAASSEQSWDGLGHENDPPESPWSTSPAAWGHAWDAA